MENEANQRVKVMRDYLGLSQNEFANAINSTPVTISRIENGSTPLSKKNIIAMISAFGISKEWLINGVGEMTFEKVELPAKEVNPWRDALVQQLQEEISFLREIVSNMSKSKSGSFLKDIAPVGVFGNKNISNIVRAQS